jgi:hypothetical protein
MICPVFDFTTLGKKSLLEIFGNEDETRRHFVGDDSMRFADVSFAVKKYVAPTFTVFGMMLQGVVVCVGEKERLPELLGMNVLSHFNLDYRYDDGFLEVSRGIEHRVYDLDSSVLTREVATSSSKGKISLIW